MEIFSSIWESMFFYWRYESITKYVVWYGIIHVGIYLIAFVVDRIAFGPYKIHAETRTSLKHDYLCTFLELLNARQALANMLVFGGILWIFDNLPSIELNRYFEGTLASRLIGLLFFLMVYDFLLYWYHRLSHTGPLWIQHEYHHSPVELTPLSDIRIHALSFPFLALIVLVPARMLYTLSKPEMLFFYSTLDLLSICAHSRWNVGYGWIGKYVLVSPRHHRLHHTNSGSKHSNFGTYLVFWDRLFGTYRDSSHAFSLPVGVPNNPFTDEKQSLLKAYLLVYVRFFKSIRDLIFRILRIK